MLAVYAYTDASGVQRRAESDAFNFAGSWSSTTQYRTSTLDTVRYGTGNGQYVCIVDNIGYNPQTPITPTRPQKWSALVLLIAATNETSGTIPWSGTLAYNLGGSPLQTTTMAGDLAISVTGVAPGNTATVRLLTDGTNSYNVSVDPQIALFGAFPAVSPTQDCLIEFSCFNSSVSGVIGKVSIQSN